MELSDEPCREDLRGQGHGHRLVEAAEAEARARGCQRVWLDSYTFQAPTLYQQFGYQVFGVLHGYPAPNDRVFLTKTLSVQLGRVAPHARWSKGGTAGMAGGRGLQELLQRAADGGKAQPAGAMRARSRRAGWGLGGGPSVSPVVGVPRARFKPRKPQARKVMVAWWRKPGQERPSKWSRPSSSLSC